MASELLKKVRTKDERDRLLAEIDMVSASLYQIGALDRVLKSQVRFWASETMRLEMPTDTEAIKSYLNSLKQDLEKMDVLRLKLAFEPTEISIDKFYSYLDDKEKEQIILDFEYDPSILGGAHVTWRGQYRDFSLRRLFEEEYDKKQKEIIQIMYTK